MDASLKAPVAVDWQAECTRYLHSNNNSVQVLCYITFTSRPESGKKLRDLDLNWLRGKWAGPDEAFPCV